MSWVPVVFVVYSLIRCWRLWKCLACHHDTCWTTPQRLAGSSIDYPTDRTCRKSQKREKWYAVILCKCSSICVLCCIWSKTAGSKGARCALLSDGSGNDEISGDFLSLGSLLWVPSSALMLWRLFQKVLFHKVIWKVTVEMEVAMDLLWKTPRVGPG